MIGVSTSSFNLSMLRTANVWYSICDGNWSNPNTWLSNSRKKHSSPQVGDTVYVDHVVTVDINATVNNIYVAGTISFTASQTLTINGDLQVSGAVDQSAGGNTIVLNGYNNYIATYSAGSSSVMRYSAATYTQNIMPLTYCQLSIGGGEKTLTGDITVNNSTGIDGGAKLDLSSFNATFNAVNLTGTLLKSSSTGSVNFNGAVISDSSQGSITFSLSPIVNLSGGLTGDWRNGGLNLGSGTINVLSSQTFSFSNAGNQPQSLCTNATIIIASGKTLTYSGASPMLISGAATITGVDGTSILNINSSFAFGNTNTVMATGVFNYNNSGTSNIYVEGVTLTLPFTTFYQLTINGIATLSENTTVSNNLSIGGASSLQISTYNLTVSGSTTYAGTLLCSGSGAVNFNTLTAQVSTGAISFVGNPTVNLSGNISGDSRSGFNFGSGTVNITGNISIGVWTSGNLPVLITWNIVIGSGKTLINSGISNASGGLITTGTITGADSTAVFDNRSLFSNNNSTAPMATGKLFCNEATNTFTYGLSGNQDITPPSDATPGYQNLTLNGSGAKRLLGSVSVKGTYTLTSPATLNSNGFSLTNP